MTEAELSKIEIGAAWTKEALKRVHRVVVGGVAWPSERPGYAVVVGVARSQYRDSYPVYLLDEFESFDLQELITQCGVLHCKYAPKQWIGDGRHEAAERLIWDMNDRFAKPADPYDDEASDSYYPSSDQFYPWPTPMLEMQRPYAYFLPQLKTLLAQEGRQLFLKASRVVEHLSQVKPDEIAFMEYGAYPAIEALALAVLEARESAAEQLPPGGPTRPLSPMAG